jgi:hypothetical protein
VRDERGRAIPPAAAPVEKPKRNWRGWLKEYAVIVIGVLTALAAEQTAISVAPHATSHGTID